MPGWCHFRPVPPCPHPLPQANALAHILSQLLMQQTLTECILWIKDGPWRKAQIESGGGSLSTIPKTFLGTINGSAYWGLLGPFHKSSIFRDWSQSDLGPFPIPGQRFSVYRTGLLLEIQLPTTTKAET